MEGACIQGGHVQGGLCPSHLRDFGAFLMALAPFTGVVRGGGGVGEGGGGVQGCWAISGR